GVLERLFGRERILGQRLPGAVDLLLREEPAGEASTFEDGMGLAGQTASRGWSRRSGQSEDVGRICGPSRITCRWGGPILPAMASRADAPEFDGCAADWATVEAVTPAAWRGSGAGNNGIHVWRHALDALSRFRSLLLLPHSAFP